MSEDRDYCYVTDCSAPDDRVGSCDHCGISICEHHAVILGDFNWGCPACLEAVPEKRRSLGIPILAAILCIIGWFGYENWDIILNWISKLYLNWVSKL